MAEIEPSCYNVLTNDHKHTAKLSPRKKFAISFIGPASQLSKEVKHIDSCTHILYDQ